MGKLLTILLSSIIASVAIASESENFFVRISADKGEITAHADGSFSITPTTTSTTNAINVTIAPKLDWQLITPRSGKMTVSPSKTGAYRLLSILGEDSPTGKVHVCSYPVTTVTNHLSSPRMGIDFEVAGSPFIYASPNTGCDIAVGGNANKTATGLHEIITTYAPCPKCGSAPATPEEHSTFETSFDRYSWRITAGAKTVLMSGKRISKTLPNVSKGAHQVSATCNATYSQCSQCTDSKTQITNAIVSELTIECPPWLGLDRTDAATITTNTAIAHLTPEQDNLSCSWINGSFCDIAPSCDTFRCNIWQPDNNNASSSYLAETITASVGNASISTNFTVVKVDVIVEDIDEDKEETEGDYSICANDVLTDLIVNCYPSDLPSTEQISITIYGSNCEILEKRGSVYFPANQSHSAATLAEKFFKIRIIHPSTTMRDIAIQIIHENSCAEDLVKETGIKLDFVIRSDGVSDYHSNNAELLQDGYPAIITIISSPTSLDLSKFDVAFSAKPEYVTNIVNKYGTNVNFYSNKVKRIWNTSPIYWYGIMPDAECYSNTNSYIFTLFLNSKEVCKKSVLVFIPKEASHIKTSIDLDDPVSNSIGPYPVEKFENGILYTNYYTITYFSNFKRTSLIYNIPEINQYRNEIIKEETFHLKQWQGEVSSEEGGTTDCYSALGICYYAKLYCESQSYLCKIENTNNLCLLYIEGVSSNNLERITMRASGHGQLDELNASAKICREEKGFAEFKAKEYAGYNAAYLYHCTYEKIYGSNPTNIVHSAYK